MMMKVCVFGTRGFPHIQGGVEKHCECLYPLIASDRIRITVFRRKPYLRPGYEPYAHIRFIDLPSTRIKGFEAALHSFLATLYCLAMRPDVVHIHNIGPALFSPLLKLISTKIILTYHSPNYEHRKWNIFARHILKLSERIALRTASKVIFVNDCQRLKFSCRVISKSIYIPNGISRPHLADDDAFLESCGILRHKYVLSVGRITPEKGLDCLIRAFRKTFPAGEYRLVIAGGVDGEQAYYAELKKNAGQDGSNNIIFTGFVEGEPLAQLYTHAALFVLPSSSEGMPIALLEAMSYNLPILASDIPANRAVGLPDNAYFRAGDDDTLTLCLRTALAAEAKRIRYDSSEEYDWTKIAAKTKDVYLSLYK
jgi:glycosyltransferase involved in cell wall biosynthesis